MLHSEYITQEFDAITQHPNVSHLHPNSSYARVQTNYDNNTLTLVRSMTKVIHDNSWVMINVSGHNI